MWFSLLQNRRLIRGIFDTYSFVIYVFVVKVSSTYFGVPPARTGDEIVFQELDKLSWIIRRKTVWACRRPGSVPMGWRQLFLKRMKEKDGRDSRIYIGKNGDKRWWPKMVAYPRDGSCLFGDGSITLEPAPKPRESSWLVYASLSSSSSLSLSF